MRDNKLSLDLRRICFRIPLSVAAFLLAIAGLTVTSPPNSGAQTAAPAPVQTLPDAWNLYGDSLAAVRKGLLFQSEDKTASLFPATIPLIVDKEKDRLFVVVPINGQKIRLIVDTGGGHGVTLNKKDADGIVLEHSLPVRLLGFQGHEPATEGIAQDMMFGPLLFRAIDTVVMNSSTSKSTLSTQAFERYCVTLDFIADTMALSQGGEVSAAAKGEKSISVPFHDDDGAILVPVPDHWETCCIPASSRRIFPPDAQYDRRSG